MEDTPPRNPPLPPAEPGRARHRHPERLPTPSAPASVFVCGWLLAAASAVVFLAAGPVQGSLGIFLVAAGVALTFFPARVRVEWPLWIAIGGLLVCASLAFLPAGWFPLPGWRVVLGNTPGVHLPTTVTPVPWETGFWLAILAVTCVTGLFVLAHPVRSRAVFALAAAAAAVCGVYAALSIYAWQTGWHYPFTGGATFGFFPNRNHTATFLVTGSITTLGVLTIGLREGRWVLSALVGACLAACVAGLFFYSGSRGGVLFLVAGTLLWVAGLRGSHRNVPLLVSVVVLVVASGVLFLVSGGEARARLLGTDRAKATVKSEAVSTVAGHVTDKPRTGGDHDMPLDFRVLIYRDTAALIRDAPVSGTGLGAFVPVFAQYRRASLSGSAALHPESDWMMLAAEAGVPALVCALVVCGLLLLRLRGAHEHPFWPLRWGCAAAAATALLHGVVDVPAHRVALGWWVLLLAALGLQTARGHAEKSPWVQRGLFVLAGLGALTLGTQLIRAEWFGARALPPFAADKAREEILAAFYHQDAPGALERAQAAVETSPMAAPLYYQVGNLLLRFEGTDAEADAAFQAQRRLDPSSASVPLQQGDTWLPIDPKRAVALWLEALDRQARIDRAQHDASFSKTDAFFRSLLDRAATSPDAQRELAAAAARSPGFTLAWLDGASAPVVDEKIPFFAAQPTLLARFSEGEQERFLLRWYAKGSREELTRFLQENESWRPAGWPVELRSLLDGSRYEEAVRVAAEHYHISLALPAFAPPEDRPVEIPPPPGASAVSVFVSDWHAGNVIAARRVLEDAAKADTGSTLDPEVWRLRAAFDAQDTAWPSAWQNLDRYLRATQNDETVP